jgi:hypothetical protein
LECHIVRSIGHRGYVRVTERGLYADEQGTRRYEASIYRFGFTGKVFV